MSAAVRSASATPVEVGRANDSDVRIVWKDGHVSVYPSRSLRLLCACASCVHEFTGEKILRESAVPPDCRPLAIHAVGRYAVRIDWSDGHGTGIYTFERLRRLCPCEACSADGVAVLRDPSGLE